MTALAIDADGLVAGTAGAGLWRLRGERVVAQESSVDPMVWALARGPAGLLVGTFGGLFEQDGSDLTRRSNRDVRAIVADDLGAVVGTFGDGVHGAATEAAPLDYIAALDRRGRSMCIGGPRGLAVYRPGTGWRTLRSLGPSSNDISALAHDGRRLWVGTFDQGLSVQNGGGWSRVEGVDPKVNALAVEHTSRGPVVWAATARGLARLVGTTVRRFGSADGLASSDVHTVVALRGGGVAAGTSKGLVIVRNGRVEPVHQKHGLFVRGVWAIAEDADGGLWLGTTRGLFYGPRARRSRPRRWTRLSIASGHLTDDWVTAVAVDEAGRVWAGTYSGGVARLEARADSGWSSVALGGGWINIGGLTVTGPNVFAATMDGLIRWDERNGGWQPVRKAAPGRDVTAMVAGKGRWWIASRRGLAAWNTLPERE